MAFAFPFAKKKVGVSLAPYGGGIRPPVMGPAAIKNSLGKLSFIRATMTAMIVSLLVINGIYINRLIQTMDTQLYVADGTPFSCPVEGL